MDHGRRTLEYETIDHVFICVISMKGQSRFGKKGKLSPRYIRPFQILERLGPVAYEITEPSMMEQMHNVFYMSMLRGYLRDPFHIIDYHQIALDNNMEYEARPIQIINRKVNGKGGMEGTLRYRGNLGE
ncbi:uncharacterized protein LOC114259786 [Camellia sinensis]|uniref:uncharacterized protein LOC114259786 n=1 Tax=Camellia sinensis TaxID=4442 RepID=UPI001036696D|nr:uncharacterized protein LOC114259786 [Camellia sinensis]